MLLKNETGIIKSNENFTMEFDDQDYFLITSRKGIMPNNEIKLKEVLHNIELIANDLCTFEYSLTDKEVRSLGKKLLNTMGLNVTIDNITTKGKEAPHK